MFLLVSVHHVGAHPGGHQHGVSILGISINLGKTFLRISRIRNILLTWILARNLVYLPPFISQIPDFIYWMVLILILIYFEWHDTENQRYKLKIHSAFACSRWPPPFPDLSRPYGAWVKRGSGKHMFSLSLFHPRSRQSNISTSGEEKSKYTLPRKNKISQMPFPRANKDNQIPTPCPAFLPPPPHLPPAWHW